MRIKTRISLDTLKATVGLEDGHAGGLLIVTLPVAVAALPITRLRTGAARRL